MTGAAWWLVVYEFFKVFVGGFSRCRKLPDVNIRATFFVVLVCVEQFNIYAVHFCFLDIFDSIFFNNSPYFFLVSTVSLMCRRIDSAALIPSRLHLT